MALHEIVFQNSVFVKTYRIEMISMYICVIPVINFQCEIRYLHLENILGRSTKD